MAKVKGWCDGCDGLDNTPRAIGPPYCLHGLNIDVAELKAERESLRFVIDEHQYSGDVVQEHLEGIDNMLAVIYDQLVPPGSGGGDG